MFPGEQPLEALRTRNFSNEIIFAGMEEEEGFQQVPPAPLNWVEKDLQTIRERANSDPAEVSPQPMHIRQPNEYPNFADRVKSILETRP